jgi:two-component system, sensor histidine kinase
MTRASTPLTVLLVEDNDDARTTLRMLITLAFGHVVHEARDGESAVQLALEHRPRLALVDLGLPGMNGNEVARRIRSELGPGEICLVALTGYDSPEDRRSTAEAGFDLHLVKPVDSAALASVFEGLQSAAGPGAEGGAG